MALLLTVADSPSPGQTIDGAQAVQLARDYLTADDDAKRKTLAASLATYSGDIPSVLKALSARTFKPVKSGYHPQEHFTVPELLVTRSKDLLYFNVPDSYRPDRPTGLIVFLHGGGKTTSRRAPRVFLNFPDEDDEESNQLGDIFAATGMIAVGPSAPWDEESWYRWCLRESEPYLADVIVECKSRFNIDPDRVFLIGHSMGGFGAYHHVQRQPDRFAAVIVSAGSWSQAYWPVIRGTPLCIVQGVHDAQPKIRWHSTDVEYARWTDKLLTQLNLDHTYFEHGGEHAVRYGKQYIARFLESAKELRRDPYYPHVALATPLGFRRSYCSSVRHNRWLTLNEAANGSLEYDELTSNGSESFDQWRLKHRKRERDASSIEAWNQGGNAIAVETKHVKRFTLWLHPRMVDPRRPVLVAVNGAAPVAYKVKPSLLTALESYERRAITLRVMSARRHASGAWSRWGLPLHAATSRGA